MTEYDKFFSDGMNACLTDAGATVIEQASMSKFTTFRLGGTCTALVDCPSVKSFLLSWEALVKDGLKPILIGGGSNILVGDRGVDDVVVRFADPEASIVHENDHLRISAGANLDDVARMTAEQGWDGLVGCSGIPGTVGGAIAGNAGAFGEQIGDRIVSLEVIGRNGHYHQRTPAELGFSYRRSNIPESGDIVVSALVALDPADPEVLLSRRREILELRSIKHPDWRTIPTAGSFFKNIEPTSKAERRQAAGWFLEQAGALKMKAGGARTFERHANIIVAGPGCRSSDVVELSEMMAAAVKEKFGIELEREVKMMGNF